MLAKLVYNIVHIYNVGKVLAEQAARCGDKVAQKLLHGVSMVSVRNACSNELNVGVLFRRNWIFVLFPISCWPCCRTAAPSPSATAVFINEKLMDS